MFGFDIDLIDLGRIILDFHKTTLKTHLFLLCLTDVLILGTVIYVCILYKNHRDKKTHLHNTFITKYKALKYYIPIRYSEYPKITPEQKNNPNLSSYFVKKVFKGKDKKNSKYRYFFILAGAGMGKTTFLLHLFKKHNSFFNYKEYYLEIVPMQLGDPIGYIKEIGEEIERKKKTILLIDGFDEWELANNNPEDAWGKLSEVIEDFRLSVITSRSQFFMTEEKVPSKVSLIGDDTTLRRYSIEPFNDEEDIKKFLDKKFRWYNYEDKQRARELVKRLEGIIRRPLILYWLDDLIKGKDKEYVYNYQLFEEIIDKWLKRECGEKQTKLKEDVLKNNIKFIINNLARHFYEKNIQNIKSSEIKDFTQKHNIKIGELKLRNRSILERDGDNYTFAHRLFWEYLVAKNAFEDTDFDSLINNFDNLNMGMIKLFYNEMVLHKEIPLLSSEVDYETLEGKEGSLKDAKTKLDDLQEIEVLFFEGEFSLNIKLLKRFKKIETLCLDEGDEQVGRKTQVLYLDRYKLRSSKGQDNTGIKIVIRYSDNFLNPISKLIGIEEMDFNNLKTLEDLSPIKNMPCFTNNKVSYLFTLPYWNEEVEKHPNYALAYNNRGVAKSDLGRHEDALEDYNKAIELDPNDALAYNNRGIAKFDLRMYEDAIEDYDKAIELNPNNALAYNNRGNAKSDLGRHEDAIEDYDKAIELNPNNANAYAARGRVKANLRMYEDAIEDCNKAIELDPNDALAHVIRGNAKYGLRMYEDAIEDYDKAIELNPNFAVAYAVRGLAKYKLGRHEDAIEDCNKAIELNPNFAVAYAVRGNAKYGLRMYKDAIEDYNKAIELDPNDALAYNNRGLAKINLDKRSEGCKDFNKAIKLGYKEAHKNIKRYCQ